MLGVTDLAEGLEELADSGAERRHRDIVLDGDLDICSLQATAFGSSGKQRVASCTAGLSTMSMEEVRSTALCGT